MLNEKFENDPELKIDSKSTDSGKLKSNIQFKSNLYPIKNIYFDDRDFLEQIHDIFALAILKRDFIRLKKFPHFRLTPLQRKEPSYHCMYTDPEDYPWGTIIDDTGEKRVVCKCIQIECKHFGRCRPDFDPKELNIIEENKRAQEIISALNEKVDIQYSDSSFVEIEKNGNSFDQDPIETEAKKTPSLELQSKSVVPREDNLSDDKSDTKEVHPIVKETTKAESEKEVKEAEQIKTNLQTDNQIIKSTESSTIGFHSFENVSQDTIIKAEPNERIIINAGPGTGKTWTLIEKILYMVNEQEVEPENILVFCFSRAAVDVIRLRMAETSQYNCQSVEIRTFDSFSTYMIAAVAEDYSFDNKNYDERIVKAVSILKEDRDILAQYENGHVIVDEVQDLVGARAELVLELLKILPQNCGFTLLGDSCQALYDYLSVNDNSLMSSKKFYSALFEKFPNAHYYSLTKNHRQVSALESLTNPYRDKIIVGTESERQQTLEEIKTNVEALTVKLQDIDKEYVSEYLRQGTLGILTRTNGQALQISSWLRRNEVHHTLQKNTRSSSFGDWIAKIFCNYEGITINEETFIKEHVKNYPSLDREIALKRWCALVDTLPVENHYKVEDILRGLIKNAKDTVLFESGEKNDTSLIVSNIHRSKGKEFDSVILIDEVIDVKGEVNKLLEHKVCYVGLTRAKKTIKHADIGAQYIRIIQNENRRCFKTFKNRWNQKVNLQHFEVGIDGDIDIKTFAANSEVQNFIKNELKPGMSVKLMKCSKYMNPYITYEIVIEEPKYMVLGYTDVNFAIELERLFKKIFDYDEIFYKLYPNKFSNVYVDEIITCVSGIHLNIPAAKVFGNMKIWSGFSITGFAKAHPDKF